MEQQGSITRFVANLHDGNANAREIAAHAIFDRYFDRLVSLATNHLGDAYRSRVGPEDIAQSAIKSFFERQHRGHFQIQCRGQLEKLLITMTLNKARSIARFHSTQKRSAAAEIHASGCAIDSDTLAFLADREPTPDEIAVLRDAIDSLVDIELKQIAMMRLTGLSDQEIGDQLDYAGETVRIKRRVIQSRLTRHFGD